MNFGNGIFEILAAWEGEVPKGGARKEIDCGNQVAKIGRKKKKKEFNYLGNEVAENEQLAKKKMIINMTDAHLLYISVVHRT